MKFLTIINNHLRLTQVLVCLFALITFAIPFSAIAQDIYKVVHVAAGDTLNLRAYPSSKSRIKIKIPHNASWIVKRGVQKKVGRAVWSKVVWSHEEGWVNSHFLSKDPLSMRLLHQRTRCMANPKQKNKVCCGYPASARKHGFRHVEILSVRGIPKGQSVPLRSKPGKWQGKVVVAIPHKASWLSALGQKKKLANGETWQYIRFNGQNGWINSAYITHDQRATQISDRKRKLCGF